MYIFPKTYEPYYTDSGKSLEFYKDLNVSWGNYQNYFSQMSVFTDPSAFDDCSHPTVASDGVMDDYIRFTGDEDAIVTVNGQRKWICYQAAEMPAGDGTVPKLCEGGGSLRPAGDEFCSHILSKPHACTLEEKWWMSPACRDAPMTCAPMITNSFWQLGC